MFCCRLIWSVLSRCNVEFSCLKKPGNASKQTVISTIHSKHVTHRLFDGKDEIEKPKCHELMHVNKALRCKDYLQCISIEIDKAIGRLFLCVQLET